ncbi:hypothetical protein PanWU01x14_193800 [Parasponia andersonii]|uniref:Uncharacterized protein n=1 Tax=Parasponia andersonii TaxID=3476 RepID=A0A2P5C0U8_PARAD|nr:hypothetical protein PanWU01x14_193800 [Parasponia andersonii]
MHEQEKAEQREEKNKEKEKQEENEEEKEEKKEEEKEDEKGGEEGDDDNDDGNGQEGGETDVLKKNNDKKDDGNDGPLDLSQVIIDLYIFKSFNLLSLSYVCKSKQEIENKHTSDDDFVTQEEKGEKAQGRKKQLQLNNLDG